MKLATNPTRFETLGLMIDQLYAEMDVREIDDEADQYDSSITEMFEIERIDDDSVTLRYLFEDELLEPVIFPEPLRGWLRKHDTFLLTLGLRDDVWDVVHMNPPYECVT